MKKRRIGGFTLVEMLVTISIIAILTGLVFGALQMARAAAREDATKATIAKINNIIMARYQSYRTRRLPLGQLIYPPSPTCPHVGQPLSPTDAAQVRLYAIRDLMRMEMPDRIEDVPTPSGATTTVGDPPISLPIIGTPIPIPALALQYYNRLAPFVANPPPSNGVDNGAAELLYMIVSIGSPEAMEQFSQSEIGDTNHNGFPEFLDGWGRPIFFLRWAPAFSSTSTPPMPSDVQTGNPVTDHDPFDPRQVDLSAYHLIPLIYSGGTNSNPGLLNMNDETPSNRTNPMLNYHFGDPRYPGGMFNGPLGYSSGAFIKIGGPSGNMGRGNITNHHIEQR